jgi:[acyl-carrier-protein] S-malonyltransferase
VGRIGGALVSRVAFLFPGQGSQHPGMGRALASAWPECAEVFRRADEALGMPLSRACFEGSEAELARTETTQPAILTVSVAALRALERLGVRPAAAAGHSLGEYSAHVAAGTFSFEDAVRAVRHRGRFMQDAVPEGQGAMAAILGLDPDAVRRICLESEDGDVVAAANFNGGGQVVIAGAAAAVRRAGERAVQAGARKAIPLLVSAPFHCALMEPARIRLAPVLEGIEFRDPAIPVFTNVDAAPVKSGPSARDALLRQVCSPVRWEDLVRRMAESGVDTFVEVGPGRVLAGLVRRILKDARVLGAAEPAEIEAVARETGGVA